MSKNTQRGCHKPNPAWLLFWQLKGSLVDKSQIFRKNSLSLLKYHKQVKIVALNGIQDNYS